MNKTMLYIFFSILSYSCMCQNNQIVLSDLGNSIWRQELVLDSSYSKYLEEFPSEFSAFVILYGNVDSPLYSAYSLHLDILGRCPKNSDFYKKLAGLTINATRMADAPTKLWDLCKFTFENNVIKFSSALNVYSIEEIESTFRFFDDGVSEQRTIKLVQLESIEMLYPKVYQAYLKYKSR